MRIIIITQNDPFYLGNSIKYFLENKPSYANVLACVLFKPSPFGKKESFLNKLWKTLRLFGPKFFFKYGIYYLAGKTDRMASLRYVLKREKIPMLSFKENINHPDSISLIASYQPDLLISIAGNQIFKRNLISIAPRGCLNLHTALLPKYRGLMPTFWVLKNEETETGVSVFFVDEGIDSGPILVQKKTAISSSETQRDLIIRTKRLGMEAIIEAIDLIHKGNYQLIPNDESQKTYYSFPTRQDIIEFKRKGKKFF